MLYFGTFFLFATFNYLKCRGFATLLTSSGLSPIQNLTSLPMSLLFECGDAAPDWPFFRHVILDCDSTLCSIEGIDCLAAHPDTNKKVVALTEAAMNGELPLVEAYQHRLELIAPTHQAVRSLAKQYQQHLVPRSR